MDENEQVAAGDGIVGCSHQPSPMFRACSLFAVRDSFHQREGFRIDDFVLERMRGINRLTLPQPIMVILCMNFSYDLRF